MSRGGVGDATGTVPEVAPGALTPCPRRKRSPDQAEANDRGRARHGGRGSRRALVSPGEEAYAAEVGQLSWSNPAIASEIRIANTVNLEALSAPAPPFCADARAWAQSDYRALSAASREFEASRAARKSSDPTEERSLSTLLKPYENALDRTLIRKTKAVANKLLASALATVGTVLRLDRSVGFP
jgi:hypothetical protein